MISVYLRASEAIMSVDVSIIHQRSVKKTNDP